MNAQIDVLTPYQWKNCILIVFSESKENSLFKEQNQLFFKHKEGLEERDIVVLQVFEDGGIASNQQVITESDIIRLQEKFEFYFSEEDTFAVFLVGKDGGTKLPSKNKILPIEKLFSVIDAMPMRQREMRESTN